MDERLEKALEFSKYLVTYNNQKEILAKQFLNECVFYHNGGKFTIDRNLILYANIANIDILIDDNNIPIEIQDTKFFYETIKHQYENAVLKYNSELRKISKNKDVSGLIDG